MTSSAMQAYLDGARDRTREHIRRKALHYMRDKRALYRWTHPGSDAVVFRAVHRPYDRDATKSLCRALWADLQTARAMPKFYQSRAMRIRCLREMFAGECAAYLRLWRAATLMEEKLNETA